MRGNEPRPRGARTPGTSLRRPAALLLQLADPLLQLLDLPLHPPDAVVTAEGASRQGREVPRRQADTARPFFQLGLELLALLAPFGLDRDRLAGAGILNDLVELVRVGDVLAVDAGDHVAA